MHPKKADCAAASRVASQVLGTADERSVFSHIQMRRVWESKVHEVTLVRKSKKAPWGVGLELGGDEYLTITSLKPDGLAAAPGVVVGALVKTVNDKSINHCAAGHFQRKMLAEAMKKAELELRLSFQLPLPDEEQVDTPALSGGWRPEINEAAQPTNAPPGGWSGEFQDKRGWRFTTAPDLLPARSIRERLNYCR